MMNLKHRGKQLWLALALPAVFIVFSFSFKKEKKPNVLIIFPDQYRQFSLVETKVLFEDDGTTDWATHWMLDGERATVTNSTQGMAFIAGSEIGNDSCHAVLWTRQSFAGDISIEYEYTRIDTAIRFVNILYFMATGKGDEGHSKDISLWNEKRQEPAMDVYFNYMNTYHISYAAFPVDNDGTQVDYIRLRRYRPGGTSGLSDTDFPGDVFDTGLFKTGVAYRVKVILLGTTIEMQVQNMENPQEQKTIKWDASIFPLCREGRVGLRHMYGRSARYKNFTVRQVAPKGPALFEE